MGTYFVCPILWARSMACKSACGFQSLSYNTTVSALIRLIPRPPALVLNKNMNLSEFFLVKLYIYSSRDSMEVSPSILLYLNYLKFK